MDNAYFITRKIIQKKIVIKKFCGKATNRTSYTQFLDNHDFWRRDWVLIQFQFNYFHKKLFCLKKFSYFPLTIVDKPGGIHFTVCINSQKTFQAWTYDSMELLKKIMWINMCTGQIQNLRIQVYDFILISLKTKRAFTIRLYILWTSKNFSKQKRIQLQKEFTCLHLPFEFASTVSFNISDISLIIFNEDWHRYISTQLHALFSRRLWYTESVEAERFNCSFREILPFWQIINITQYVRRMMQIL